MLLYTCVEGMLAGQAYHCGVSEYMVIRRIFIAWIDIPNRLKCSREFVEGFLGINGR